MTKNTGLTNEYHLRNDPSKINNADSTSIGFTKDKSKFNTDQCLWTVVKKEGTDNVYTIRNGEYFLFAPLKGKMNIVHESQTSQLEDTRSIQFVIECTSDNFGKLITQPSR